MNYVKKRVLARQKYVLSTFQRNIASSYNKMLPDKSSESFELLTY